MRGVQIAGYNPQGKEPGYYITGRVREFDGTHITTESGGKYRLRGMSTYQQLVYPGTRWKLSETNPSQNGKATLPGD